MVSRVLLCSCKDVPRQVKVTSHYLGSSYGVLGGCWSVAKQLLLFCLAVARIF